MPSREAFGGPADDTANFVNPGIHRWGIFDGQLLAAKASDREYVSMIGGRPVTTVGAAGVVVAPEYRGTGLARKVMTHLLAEARAAAPPYRPSSERPRRCIDHRDTSRSQTWFSVRCRQRRSAVFGSTHRSPSGGPRSTTPRRSGPFTRR